MESKPEGSIKFPALLAAPLLILMAALAGGAALRESITIDEVAHLGAAVSYPQKRDLRLNEEYPPLAKILAALPLVLWGIHTDYSDISWIFSNGWFNAMLGYESAKARITRALLDLVERHHAGFANLIEYSELGTPLTFEHFTAAPAGAIYGYPGTLNKYRRPWLKPRTPIRNLYLTGSDVGLLGIMGALMVGVLTARCLLGPFGFFKIMHAANRPLLDTE